MGLFDGLKGLADNDIFMSVMSGVPYLGDMTNTYQQYQNLKYQKKLQKQIFEREDNATQRRVADLQAAGLSPVLAAGSAAGSGAVVNTAAPQGNTRALQNVLEIQQMRKNIAKTQAETGLLNKQREKIDPEISQLKAAKAKTDSDAYLNYKSAKLRDLDYSKGQHDYKIAKDTGLLS